MNGKGGFAVFFYPQALEALGEAIKPYLQENGEVGTHVACEEIDTAVCIRSATSLPVPGGTEHGHTRATHDQGQR